MKKTIIFLGLAFLTFGNVSYATNSTSRFALEENYNNTPLCSAIVKGDLGAVMKFIEYGVDINETSNGMTPLMFAARYNKVDILKALIARGAEVDVKDEKGFTALKYAELSNAKDAAEFLKSL